MIRAAFYTCGHAFVSVEVSGHAEYAEHGEDIICAGVSALVIAIANGLERQGIPCRNSASDGKVKIALQSEMNQDQQRIAQALLETLHDGLQDIASSTEGPLIAIQTIRLEEVGKCSQ